MSMILLTFLHIGMVMGCLAGLLAGMMAEDFRGMSFSTCRPATLQCELEFEESLSPCTYSWAPVSPLRLWGPS